MTKRATVWDADSASLTAAKAEQPAPPVPRLLAIDSDSVHRMIICRTADKAGYIPAEAANFTEAAKLMQTAAFDCITLDLSFGQHAVGEMLSHLRASGCEAPILVIGNDDAARRKTLRVAKSLGLNVGEPLLKPVDAGLLRYSLERMRIQRTLQRGLAAVGA